ncbi:branched-chain amino acid aminotransferase, possible 4-amino-4-deoxychorismate lyase PabC [Campylobacter iguaniorum]|uniref:aminotransferase class IV n=1 Tax=Campylobacter iguaniorum TaxID=1244531 RepID=UPI00073A4A52|nr:aminotransferase class IV [Campylobacter iguaniorum]ALV24809.1 branched-chain amino acid aminotransferase, possible 4-amino-4-deoxychorismate lyase PabC [Campylobacter iguaniorum]
MKSLETKSIFLFETIKIVNFEPLNLDFHIDRAVNSTSQKLKFDFKSILKSPLNGLVRAKVVFEINGNLHSVEYFAYKMRDFYEFKLTKIDFDYSKKYLDRGNIEKITPQNSEIIMLKNDLVTDTSIANIAIFDEISGSWITPKIPLLKGTTRARLLQNGFLKEANITKDMLLKAKRFAIMNAMIGFYELKSFKFS